MTPFRKRERSFRQNSAVNVTPLVDVMLVLLIIFMVTAPMMTTSIHVDLPTSSAAQSTTSKDPVIVSLDARGRIFLQDAEVPKDDLLRRLTAVLQANPGACVYVRGDKKLTYEAVMDLISFLAESGIEKVALVAEEITSRSHRP